MIQIYIRYPWNYLIAGLLILLLGLSSSSQVAGQATERGIYQENFADYTYKATQQNTTWDSWQQEVRLSYIDGSHQEQVVMASDGQNGVIIAWRDRRDGIEGDIYAQRYDSQGNPVWQAEVRVNSDSGDNRNVNPAIAVDGEGNAIIVWKDTRNGFAVYNTYAQKISPQGEKLWSNDRLVGGSSDSSSDVARESGPDVAVDSSNNVAVVWQELGSNNTHEVYAQRLSATGQLLWSSAKQINSITTGEQVFAKVGTDQNDNLLIAWHDSRFGRRHIYAQKVSTTGQPVWSSEIQVDSSTGRVAELGGLSVTVDQSGRSFLAWTDEREFTAHIYAQRLDASGSRAWPADLQITTDQEPDQNPAARVDATGNIVLTWWRGQYVGATYAQKLSTNGDTLWTETRVSSERAVENPAVALNNAGEATFAWSDYRNNNSDVYGQQLDSNGNKLWSQDDVRLSQDSGGAIQKMGSYFRGRNLSVSQNHQALIVWEDERNDDEDVFMRAIDQNGQRAGQADIQVNSSDQGYNPSLATNRSGGVVVWVADWLVGQLLLQRVDSQGNQQWQNPVSLSEKGSQPTVAMTENDQIIVVWQEYTEGQTPDNEQQFHYNQKFDIFAQWLDATGQKLGQPLRVNANVGEVRQQQPYVELDGNGNAIIVWGDHRNSFDDHIDIYAQKLSQAGVKLWPQSDVKVNSVPFYDNQENGDLDLAVDTAGNSVVVWESRSNFNSHVYAQRLSSAGNRMWATDIQVDNRSSSVEPTVAINSQNQAIVLWVQNTQKLMAQAVAENGTKIWNTDGLQLAEGNINKPIVAADTNGEVVVAWEEGNTSNLDMYMQRLSSSGSTIWANNLKLVEPDQFYMLEGSVESRTVDTIDTAIHQATLTSEALLNNGQIQFELSNDGGQNWAAVTPGVTHLFDTTGSDLRWRAIFEIDPLWNRSPILKKVTIAYNTPPPTTNEGDAYEADDSCQDAKILQVNGAAQTHNFHQAGDNDWAYFEGEAGTEYLIQANHVGDEANPDLKIYQTCDTVVNPEESDSFGSDARLRIKLPSTGTYYLQVSNAEATVAGENTEYQLSVRTERPKPLVVIIAGRNERDQLAQNIDYMADSAYRTFRRAGVPHNNIHYLNPGSNRDADQDGQMDVNGQPTFDNLRYAIQDWPREQGLQLGVPFYLYLVDHGGNDFFCAMGCRGNDKFSTADLNLWLSNLEATTGAEEVNIIIEACFSGSFIEPLTDSPADISDPGRVVIASTGTFVRAFASERGGHFSDAFFTSLADNADLWAAYDAGRRAARAASDEQTPWLDDNGDGVADSLDGKIARGRGLSLQSGIVPVVDSVTLQTAGVGQPGTLQVKARDDSQTITVTTEIYAPDLVIPETGEGETPELNVPRVILSDADGDGLYENSYDGFTTMGEYRLVAYAQDTEGNLSLPRETVVMITSSGVITPTPTPTITPTLPTTTTPTTTPMPSNTPTPQATPVPVSATISPTGGTLANADQSITVEFPAQAVTSTIVVTLSNQTITPPADKVSINRAFTIEATQNGQPITQFAQPLTLIIKYQEVGQAAEETLQLYWFDGTTWQTSGLTSDLIISAKRLVATTNHLTLFAVLGTPQVEAGSKLYLPLIIK